MALAACLLITPSLRASTQASTQQKPEKPPATEPAKQPPERPVPVAQEPEKKPAKARKVFTNEDLENRGKMYSQTGSRAVRAILDQVNECNRYCFDDVWNTARGNWAGSSWKNQLLDDIEKVKNDAGWQVALGEIGEAVLRNCELQAQKAQELGKLPTRDTVTAAELRIEETYERKFKEAAKALAEASDRAKAYAQQYRGEALRNAFMENQVNRLVRAQCRSEEE